MAERRTKDGSKTERVEVRVSRKEFKKLEYASAKSGKTKSDILRDYINGLSEKMGER